MSPPHSQSRSTRRPTQKRDLSRWGEIGCPDCHFPTGYLHEKHGFSRALRQGSAYPPFHGLLPSALGRFTCSCQKEVYPHLRWRRLQGEALDFLILMQSGFVHHPRTVYASTQPGWSTEPGTSSTQLSFLCDPWVFPIWKWDTACSRTVLPWSAYFYKSQRGTAYIRKYKVSRIPP